MAVLFPDVEKTVVAYLKANLPNGTFVATKKPAPDAQQPEKQVIVSVAYNGENQQVLKYASLTLEVFADTYSDASALGLLVESKIRGIADDPIKKATVMLGPVRVAEDSEKERRMIDVELIVKGENA